MFSSGKDPGIQKIISRNDHLVYGMGLGVIILDDVYPAFPGDERNASAYPFPIQYEIAEGVDIYNLVVETDKSPCLEPVLQAARRLERIGVRAIRSLSTARDRYSHFHLETLLDYAYSVVVHRDYYGHV